MAQVYDASLLTQEAYAAAKATAGAIITGMSQNSVQVYLKAANHAAARVGVVGEQAMKEAVQMMAAEGVHAYTYTRKDGTLVRVPADVGIRRAVYTAGRTRLNDQTMNVALETRHDLIEVNETRNCRPSHELINGKVFSLSGADPKYPKWDSACDACLHDYNCGHSIRIYNELIGKSFSNAMARSDQGTLEERRELVTRQRALENRIRKQKRTVDALKAAGQDTKPANARLNATRAQLRDLIAANSKVLYRDAHREQVYDSAARMAGKNLAAKVKKPISGVEIEKAAFSDELQRYVNGLSKRGAFSADDSYAADHIPNMSAEEEAAFVVHRDADGKERGYLWARNSWEINRKLREGENHFDAEDKATVDAIDAVAGRNKLDKDTRVFRLLDDAFVEKSFGVSVDDVLSGEEELAGKSTVEKGYQSVSYKFNGSSFQNRRVLLNMVVKKGTGAVWTENSMDAEIVLQRGMNIKIVGAASYIKYGDHYYLVLDAEAYPAR